MVGRIQSHSWEQDGQKRSKVEVLGNDVTFLDSRGNENESSAPPEHNTNSNNSSPSSKSSRSSKSKKSDDVVIDDIGDEPINLDDIPF